MRKTFFYKNRTLNLGGKLIVLEKPLVMGILNVTPDSFYSGSRLQSEKDILQKAEKMLLEGADILDFGGYSTRPNADDISEEEEISRLIPAIKSIVSHFPQSIISADTFRAQVAAEAIEAGAQIINDISGGQADARMFDVVAQARVPYVLMHTRGTPQTMQKMTNYDDLIGDLLLYFREKSKELQDKGALDVLIDPGFGFAKTTEQNFEILNQLEMFRLLGKPIIVGLSRKSMIYKSLFTEAENALNGTTALHSIALMKGADILRVHDVKEAVEVVKLVCCL